MDDQQDAQQRQRRPGPAAGGATPRGRRIRRGTRGDTRGRTSSCLDLVPRSRGRRSPGRAPATLQVTSIRREAPSRLISLGAGTIATSATSPSGTCVPSGVSIGRSQSCETSLRTSSTPQTKTSKIFCSLVELADLRPLDQRGRRAADVAGRQAEPGRGLGPEPDVELRHERPAARPSGSSTPSIGSITLSTSCALARSTSRSGPKIRTTIVAPGAGQHLLDPLLQVGQHVAGTGPG